MRLFIGEFICGGGLTTTRFEEIPASLWREGGAMLAAVVGDAVKIPGVTPVVPLDGRYVGLEGLAGVETRVMQPTSAWSSGWGRLAGDCDAVLAIAPEDGPMAEIYGMLADAGPLWLGCRNEALDAGISKNILAELLVQAGIPTPPTLTADEVGAGLKVDSSRGWVTKPIDGCGSQGIRIWKTWEEVTGDLKTRSKSRRIVQPLYPGRPASCSVLCGSAGYLALPAMWQHLAPADFQYLGGEGPLESPLTERAQRIAIRAVEALGEGAGGYIGVDLLLGDAEDGSDDAVIEVNPRITTSYVGLRHLVTENLLGMMLDLARGKPVSYAVRSRRLRFDSDGLVRDM